MSEIREKQRNVEYQKQKLTEKSLEEVPVPTKKARVCASVPKQASKKKSKKKSNNNNNNNNFIHSCTYMYK